MICFLISLVPGQDFSCSCVTSIDGQNVRFFSISRLNDAILQSDYCFRSRLPTDAQYLEEQRVNKKRRELCINEVR